MQQQLTMDFPREARSRRSNNFVTTHQAIVHLRKHGWSVTPQPASRHRLRKGPVDLMNMEDNDVRFAARQQGWKS